MSGFRADDRVLLLATPAVGELAALARILMRGSVVVISTADEIAAIGEQLAEFNNVMLLEASPDKIPWRDGGFTRIRCAASFGTPAPLYIERTASRACAWRRDCERFRLHDCVIVSTGHC